MRRSRVATKSHYPSDEEALTALVEYAWEGYAALVGAEKANTARAIQLDRLED